MVGIKRVKKKGFNTQAEILDFIQKELYRLLAICKDRLAYRIYDYHATAWISSNDGRSYHSIVGWYINSTYYLDNFIGRVKIELDRATIKNKIYLIKFDFGSNSKTFKYKHA